MNQRLQFEQQTAIVSNAAGYGVIDSLNNPYSFSI